MSHRGTREGFIQCYFHFIFINILIYDVVSWECLCFNFYSFSLTVNNVFHLEKTVDEWGLGVSRCDLQKEVWEFFGGIHSLADEY